MISTTRFLVLTILTLWFTSCNFVSSIVECPQELPVSLSAPPELSYVFPQGTVSLSSVEYQSSFMLFDTEPGIIVFYKPENIITALFVEYDGKTYVSRKSRFLVEVSSNNEATMFAYIWEIDITPGFHVAQINLLTDSWEIASYEWAFCMTP